MNLIIDRGNTLTKAAVVDRGRIVSMQSFERLDMRRLDQFVGRCGAIDKAIICSTAGDTEALAQHLNVSPQAVSKWEMDLSRPARGKLARLSEVLPRARARFQGRAPKK